jgi:predicted glycoside hydrolase/deacetylase ChbG (UPF0249 family)
VKRENVLPDDRDVRLTPLLVVVADDGGVDVARNRGIVDGIVQGVVSSVSVLANGEAVEDLAARIGALPARLRPDIGLHLNLTEGLALAGAADGLTDAAGRFIHGKRGLWEHAVCDGVDVDAVCAEALAQIARLDALGLSPMRVDGHQHVHVLPGIRDGLARALAEVPTITWVRLGRPVVAAHELFAGFPRIPPTRVARPWASIAADGRFAQAALGTMHDECGVLRARGRRSPDVFAGADLVAECSRHSMTRELEAAARLIRSLAPDGGVIELMTHPGECDFESVDFSAKAARELEHETLCSEGLRELLGELNVRLGRFRDATPRAGTGA